MLACHTGWEATESDGNGRGGGVRKRKGRLFLFPLSQSISISLSLARSLPESPICCASLGRFGVLEKQETLNPRSSRFRHQLSLRAIATFRSRMRRMCGADGRREGAEGRAVVSHKPKGRAFWTTTGTDGRNGGRTDQPTEMGDGWTRDERCGSQAFLH